ncbi:MAG: cystathionine gamma-synthase family protein [Bacteriovoracaceae bacterium]|jgi:cystathionine gamma-synthase|nr:cystathionine gamma-synthase [Halobacteriovoraceae bacterium]MDP7319435.1 cystathionine gamma-synthase family protein [Bacteriovoracaceae bacterium]
MSKKVDWTKVSEGTKAIWSGELDCFQDHASQMPVVLSVAYGYEDLDEWYDVALGKKKGHIYSRNTNPTTELFEEKMRIIENAEASTSFSTGMAAISNTLFALLKPEDRVVSIKDSYGGTSKIFLDFLPKNKVNVVLCETGNHEEMEAEIAKGCKLVYLETPTNPTLKIIDIQRIVKAAKKVGAIVVVDNTFSTPINQKPLDLGADISLHSATKFLGGHSDATAGIVCGSKELVQKIFHYREITGATIHPLTSYLLVRSLKTLELRIQRHNENALELAKYLDNHEKIEHVFYPGLESHPGHAIAKKQMKGFGGVLSFTLKGDYNTVKKFLPKLNFAHMAASLGAVGTLAGPPKTTSHVELTEEQRAQLGIPESLIRYSVGIENINDLIADFEQALSQI